MGFGQGVRLESGNLTLSEFKPEFTTAKLLPFGPNSHCNRIISLPNTGASSFEIDAE